MPDIVVNDDTLNSVAAENYFLRSDPRILVGLRATLEILRIELPLYAVRRKPGRTPAADVALAYAADYGKPRSLTVAPFKPSSTKPVATPPIALPDTDADGPGLFASTFPAR